jgi:mannose-1-phosphate guanylyltransferase
MKYAVIMAGGSGTRLWPMSRADQPKQLIPFIKGRSLLQVAADRLDGLFDRDKQLICTGEKFRSAIRAAMPRFSDEQILGEPEGRDTLAAVGLPAAVLAKRDPEAIIAVFTADHLIEPVEKFQQLVSVGLDIAAAQPNALVTFGIEPTFAATQYGYVKIAAELPGVRGAHTVEQFKEKPDAKTADEYVASGKYLWNSGMFVWRASTLLSIIARREPQVYAGLMEIAEAWDTPARAATLQRVYPTLKKISVDYAIMEPSSRDPQVQVVCVRMPVRWLDVGNWAQFAQTISPDTSFNHVMAEMSVLLDSRDNIVASSDNDHLLALIGVTDTVVIHTPRATLIASRSELDKLKDLHKEIGRLFGDDYL